MLGWARPGARRAQHGLERPPQRRADRLGFRPRWLPRPGGHGGGGSRFPRAAPLRPAAHEGASRRLPLWKSARRQS